MTVAIYNITNGVKALKEFISQLGTIINTLQNSTEVINNFNIFPNITGFLFTLLGAIITINITKMVAETL